MNKPKKKLDPIYVWRNHEGDVIVYDDQELAIDGYTMNDHSDRIASVCYVGWRRTTGIRIPRPGKVYEVHLRGRAKEVDPALVKEVLAHRMD